MEMSIVNNANGTSTIYADAAMGAGAADAMSPDALLSYCQMQLGSIDDETTQQINAQQLQLQERTAVENVENTLQGYGTTGPTNPADFAKCQDAFDQAIRSLPSGDPVATTLASQEATMAANYFPAVPANSGILPSLGAGPFFTSDGQPSSALVATNGLDPNGQQLYTWKAPANDDWQGTTTALSNLADNIKSDSEIQMLQLQDLVSERQQAVEQMTGMMTKEDQTLEDGAKAIGQ
jgi:hypothetical protein